MEKNSEDAKYVTKRKIDEREKEDTVDGLKARLKNKEEENSILIKKLRVAGQEKEDQECQLRQEREETERLQIELEKMKKRCEEVEKQRDKADAVLMGFIEGIKNCLEDNSDKLAKEAFSQFKERSKHVELREQLEKATKDCKKAIRDVRNAIEGRNMKSEAVTQRPNTGPERHAIDHESKKRSEKSREGFDMALEADITAQADANNHAENPLR